MSDLELKLRILKTKLHALEDEKEEKFRVVNKLKNTEYYDKAFMGFLEFLDDYYKDKQRLEDDIKMVETEMEKQN